MATPDIRGAYELLRRAMEQRYPPLQQGGDFSVPPNADPNNYDWLQGGLLGRLRTPQRERERRNQYDGNDGEVLANPRDPNFRRLSRVQTGNQSETPIAPSAAWDSIAGRSQFVLSGITPVNLDSRSPADGQYLTRFAPNVQRYGMAGPTYSQCADQCLHLLPSPSGDRQSSEFRQCVGKCMGRLR